MPRKIRGAYLRSKVVPKFLQATVPAKKNQEIKSFKNPSLPRCSMHIGTNTYILLLKF